MNSRRFDSLTRVFAHRGSRRGVIAAGLGLATTSVASRTLAQEATPAATPSGDPHPSADDATVDPEFLFVQPFDSGTWAPKEGEEGVFVLTLTGADANTIYFSDRPERITGLAPMQQFLDGLGFTPTDPPNAAIVASQVDGSEQDVLLIELFSPAYDAEAGTLRYDARVLADYGEAGLAHLASQQQDYELEADFGEGSLFIDDCGNGYGTCVAPNGDHLGQITIGCCWDFSNSTCVPCAAARLMCVDQFPEKCQEYNCTLTDTGGCAS